MRIALAIMVVALSAAAASLSGTVVDLTGASIAHAALDLESGTTKYQMRADESGVFRFLNLPAGDYKLTIFVPGFRKRTIQSIVLLETEPKRLPDVTLDVSVPCDRKLSRELVLLPETTFGKLSGSVRPAAKDVEVTLICRTFSPCRSTKTDFSGRFSFEMISAGDYGLNFHRDGFYPENATGYEFTVNAGWESVYDAKPLEKCAPGNCDPKQRPQRPVVGICE